MSDINLTYRTLYNEGLNKIKSVCLNVSNYDSLPSSLKSGYSFKETNNKTVLTWTILSYVSKVSSSTVETDYKNFMSKCGIYNLLDTKVTKRGVLNFFNAFSSFCSNNIRVTSSQLSAPNKYIIYVTGNPNTYSVEENDVAVATDISNMIYVMNKIATSVSKVYKVTYSHTVTH